MSALTTLVRPGPCARCGRIVHLDRRVPYTITLRGNLPRLTHNVCPTPTEQERYTRRRDRVRLAFDIVMAGLVAAAFVFVFGVVLSALQ